MIIPCYMIHISIKKNNITQTQICILTVNNKYILLKPIVFYL